jgi:enolase
VAKYNQLLRIEEQLGDVARYPAARRSRAPPGA